jgi:hypothetical protein
MVIFRQRYAKRQGLAPSNGAIAIAVLLGIVTFGWHFRGVLDERVAVAGTVRFRGSPLPKGIIRFLPQEAGLEPGGAIIVQGRYLITKSSGLVPGLYAIKITAPTLSGDGNGGTAQTTRLTELMPFDYNQRTMLFRSVQRGRNNVLDFELSPPSAAN